ncbi:MAG TPA: hypothetical protein VF499_04270 [Afipia sp.]
MLSIEFELKLRNVAVLLQTIPTLRAPMFRAGTTRACMPQNVDVHAHDFDCDVTVTVLKISLAQNDRPGNFQYGNYCAHRRAASCSNTFSISRPEVRTERGPRNASRSFNRQDELGGHSLLGAHEPVPNLGLRRADTIRQGLLPSGHIAGALQCFGR